MNIRKNTMFFRSELDLIRLTNKEKDFLIKNGFLVKNGKKFMLSPIIDIRDFGLKLLDSHELEEARMCFEICYKFVLGYKEENDKKKSEQEKQLVARDNKLIYLQYLLSKLKSGQFDNIYDVLINLKRCFTEEDMNEYNLYVYLLSFIVDFPKDNLYDVLVAPDTVRLVGVIGSEEKICSFIRRGNFIDAINLLDDFKSPGTYNVDFEVLRMLLKLSIEEDAKTKEALSKLAGEEQYEEIRTKLLDKQRSKRLSDYEIRVLLIVSNLIDRENYPYVSEVKCSYKERKGLERYSLTDALFSNEIRIARALDANYTLSHKKNMGRSLESDAIHILLEQLYFEMWGYVNIDEIKKLSKILILKGIDLGDSGLSIGDICLVRLVRAIDCYREGFIEYGDKLRNHFYNNYGWAKKNKKLSSCTMEHIEDLLREAEEARSSTLVKYKKGDNLELPKANCGLLLRR